MRLDFYVNLSESSKFCFLWPALSINYYFFIRINFVCDKCKYVITAEGLFVFDFLFICKNCYRCW